MKLAVMQPYLFPHIGYFQLIYASDLFLVYDDVAYIKQGYINRNTILTSAGPVRFTVPVPGASTNKLISELKYSEGVDKIIRMIEQSYAKAPYCKQVYPLIYDVLNSKDRSISSLCIKSYQDIFRYLGIEKEFKKTSDLDYNRSLPAQERLIELCKEFDADCYINSPGGRPLYAVESFSESGINLKFIDSLPIEYSQNGGDFIPSLSIIDALMNCSPENIVKLLGKYKLS